MRLTIDNLNKAIDKLSSYELSLYIYITKRADLKGLMTDLNMNEAKEVLGFSKQSFYNSLYALEEKQFININMFKNSKGYEVLLIDNSFKSYKDSSKPYLNLYYNFLEKEKFIQLPVQVKRFLLRAYTFIGKKKWVITNDLLKKYGVAIDDIEEYFSIETSGTNLYGDTIYHLKLKGVYHITDTNVAYQSTYHRIKALLINKHISYTDEELSDVVSTALTYKDLPTLVLRGIMASEGKISLQPKLVTSTVTRLRKRLKVDTEVNFAV
ncbi:MAG: hypothetical protein JEZ08_22570 [Clostridiales bacterium]|nr:hypothetical protein [Clostridiales bacterium]